MTIASGGPGPTHDGLTCVVMSWPRSQFQANRADVEGTCLRLFDLVPEFAERVRGAQREARRIGTAGLPNFFRKPYGRAGRSSDAGYRKDPFTAFGISDAFRDAEALARGLDDAFAGRLPYEQALAGYQRARDDVACPSVFGDGVVHDAITVTPRSKTAGTVRGRFKEYLHTGTIHGTFKLTYRVGSTGCPRPGRAKIAGGAGAFKHVKGIVEISCKAADRTHDTCVEKRILTRR